MLHKRDSAGLRLAITLIHLALWAQLGVATRAFLSKFFTLGCNGGSGWAPCLEGEGSAWQLAGHPRLLAAVAAQD